MALARQPAWTKLVRLGSCVRSPIGTARTTHVYATQAYRTLCTSPGHFAARTCPAPVADSTKVAILGSGNFGSAVAKVVGDNVLTQDAFHPQVNMWVYEELVNGQPLAGMINASRENLKYLPGVRLSSKVNATSSVVHAAREADLLVFVVPHQFARGVFAELKGRIKPGSRAISLIKGIEVTQAGIEVFPNIIQRELGIPCLALSGANIASEVAQGLFAESTIGFPPGHDHTAETFKHLFHTPQFRIEVVPDVSGVALCGALKNVVAIAAGLSDGLQWGGNAKAALIRIGLQEMLRFGREFFPAVLDRTFLQTSAGVADLITSCYGGRNRKVAEAFALTPTTFDQLEQDLLGGQKLQGIQTALEVHTFLSARGRTEEFPLFTAVYQIAFEGRAPELLTQDV